MAYLVVNGEKIHLEDYVNDKVKIVTQLTKALENKIPDIRVNGIVSCNKNTAVDNKKGQDFDIDKKNYTKHILIERLVIKDEYEFNFIDLETKEFYWSYYTSDRNYNVAKKAFENVFKYKGVKYYLEE